MWTQRSLPYPLLRWPCEALQGSTSRWHLDSRCDIYDYGVLQDRTNSETPPRIFLMPKLCKRNCTCLCWVNFSLCTHTHTHTHAHTLAYPQVLSHTHIHKHLYTSRRKFALMWWFLWMHNFLGFFLLLLVWSFVARHEFYDIHLKFMQCV